MSFADTRVRPNRDGEDGRFCFLIRDENECVVFTQSTIPLHDGVNQVSIIVQANGC